MADYYPLIARAVAGLDKSTGEARNTLYGRARKALVVQLSGVEPTLSEEDIARERQALEEAIQKVEDEVARRSPPEPEEPPAFVPPPRFDQPSSFAPPPSSFASPPPPRPPQAASEEVEEAYAPAPPDWDQFHRELDGPPPSTPSPNGPPLPAQSSPASQPPLFPPHRGDRKPGGEPKSIADAGLKGFREVMGEAADRGGAPAPAPKPPRQVRDVLSPPPLAGDVARPERAEPRQGFDDLLQPQEEPSASAPREEPRARRARPAALQQTEEFQGGGRLRSGGILPKLVALIAVLILLGAGFFAYREWGSNIAGLFESKAPTTQASRDTAPQARPKISDRVGGAQQDQSRGPASPEAAVAQRVLLYDLPKNPQEKPTQYVGSVVWRLENSSPGPGQPAEPAIRADVEIPERRIRMSLLIRRNKDASLPASHTMEILFSTPADFPSGGVADLGQVLMEATPNGRGEPFTGVRVKVTNGFFLVGLSSDENAFRRNIQLLKDRAWMNLQVIYNDGQRALLFLEKGVPGDRVIEDALTAWGQMPPSAQQ